MYNIISILIGAVVSVMIAFNGILSAYAGDYTSVVIIHLTGLIIMLLAIVVKKKKLIYDKSLPVYLYSAGIIGFFTVLFNNLAFRELGVAVPLALILLGQSLTSIIMDHYGLLGVKTVKFENKKLIGLALILIGIIIMTIF